MKTYTFHVVGMHCKSCVVLTEGELKNHDLVEHVVADLNTCCVEVKGNFEGKTDQEVADELSPLLVPHGYSLALEKQKHDAKWHDFAIAIPIAAAFVGLFILLQKLGIVNLISAGSVGYGTAFVVGLVASVSTCMAVVGGLVLSMSANYIKSGDRVRPQIYFHIARLVAFFLLGGAIGVLGSAFQLGATGTFILGLIVAIILLILGINLLDVFPFMKKWQPSLPSFVGRRVHGLKDLNHSLTPILLGVATFFLPCGFTQSMQLYTLSTGSFVQGAMTMLVFALGTLPVLALLSFGASGIHDKARSSIFFKSSGLVVIFFAVFNFINSLVGAGYIQPFISL